MMHLLPRLTHPLLCLYAVSLTSAVAAHNARLYSVYPWCGRDADRLKVQLKPVKPLKLEGMGNDWLVGAAGVMADKATDATVTIEGPKELKAAADIKVIGEVPGPENDGKPTWWLDPVIADPSKLGDVSTEDVRNWDAIRDFPRLHLSPGQPVMLWLTIKTHSLPPGSWKGKIALTDGSPARSEMPIEVEVRPVKLPVDSPIIGYSYTSFRERRDLARMALDYGINACGYYDNWDMCRELGFKFYKFAIPFANSQGKWMDTEDEVVVAEGIEPIKEIVNRLKLKPDEWGIEIFDEPFDQLAWAHVAWGVRLRRFWPEAQFWTNVGWAVNPEKNRNNVGTVKGTFDPMNPYVNVWSPYIQYFAPSDTDFLEAIRATGKPIWYYIIVSRHTRPRDGGWWMPWFAWKHRLQGWSFYSLDNYGKGGEAWRDNSCSRSYPGPTFSLWLEGLRQGVQDYKRLWLLEREGVPRERLDQLTGRILDVPSVHKAAAKLDQCASVRRELDRMLLERTGKKTKR